MKGSHIFWVTLMGLAYVRLLYDLISSIPNEEGAEVLLFLCIIIPWFLWEVVAQGKRNTGAKSATPITLAIWLIRKLNKLLDKEIG